MARNLNEKLLAALPLFQQCSKKELSRLASLCTEMSFPAGKELTRQGTLGREFFVVVSGSADVLRDGEVVATLSGGSAIGEMALLATTTRSATVVTTSPTVALVFSRREFHSALQLSPSVDRSIRQTSATRQAA